MKTKLLVGMLAMFIATEACAQAWEVTVTAGYINRKAKPVVGLPVFTFLVPVGECVQGISRTEKMIPKPIKVTQEICVHEYDGRATIIGWVFSKQRVTDLLAFKDQKNALNYGQPIYLVIDGNYVETMSGHYTIKAFRNNSF